MIVILLSEIFTNTYIDHYVYLNFFYLPSQLFIPTSIYC